MWRQRLRPPCYRAPLRPRSLTQISQHTRFSLLPLLPIPSAAASVQVPSISDVGRAVTGLLLRLPAFGRTSPPCLLAAAEGNVALGGKTRPGPGWRGSAQVGPSNRTPPASRSAALSHGCGIHAELLGAPDVGCGVVCLCVSAHRVPSVQSAFSCCGHLVTSQPFLRLRQMIPSD